jgi:NAD(P)-dependent dehydrogenase (short-subunit alcohol dehydrogenase family)
MVTTLAATELADKGIMAIPVHPGWVHTDMGGSGADISPAESASGLRKVIAELTPERSGRFWNYNGEELPW